LALCGDSCLGFTSHSGRIVGNPSCKNALLVRRLELERQLLEGLQTRVLNPAVVDYTRKRFEDELLQAVAERSQGDGDLRRQASALEHGIANQLRGLSDRYSESITTEIARLERQLAAIRERLKTSDAVTVKLQMCDARRFVETRLQNLSALWEGEPRIAREEIAKTRAKNHAQTDAAQLRCHGDLELARDTRTRGCYGGAGGPVCTTRTTEFSLSLNWRDRKTDPYGLMLFSIRSHPRAIT
jgi:hypothetical protein